MTKYHSVKKAADIVGKSESTIKRLLTSIKSDSASPDREQLLPTVAQYEQHKKDGAPFQWEISEALLRQRYPEAFGGGAAEQGSRPHSDGAPPSADSRYLLSLEEQVGRLEGLNDELQKQNTSLTTSLTALTDRVTTMLGHYQIKALGPVENSAQQLSPTEPSQPAMPTVVDVRQPASPSSAEEGSHAGKPSSTKTVKRKTSPKKPPSKKQSPFEKHTPTFHKAFSGLFRRQ